MGWHTLMSLIGWMIIVAGLGADQTTADQITVNTASLQRPPEKWDASANPLSDLLRADDGSRIQTPQQWRNRRDQLRRQWKAFFGKRPAQIPPLRTEVLERSRQPDHQRQLIRYFVEEGVSVRAYLLLPNEPHPKRPGVVVLHETTDSTIRKPVGLDDKSDQRLGLELVRRGYAVICPENYLWTEGRRRLKQAPAELFARHPKWNGMDKMTWDASRAVDVLIEGKHCDPHRIGCIGHSLGGKEALHLAAFDERIRAAVSSEGGIGLTFSNWHDLWYLGPRIREPGFPRENHEVLALIAPRPFLLLAGDSVDGDKSWAFIERSLPVYELLSGADRIGWHDHHKGHTMPRRVRELAYAWLDKWLLQ